MNNGAQEAIMQTITAMKIAGYYGLDSQLDICQEELAELIQAISKYKRGDDSYILEEIADVEIMLTQIKYLIGLNNRDPEILDKIHSLKERKLRRQLARMEIEEEEKNE